jgi:aminopeptidase YwaD
MLKISSEELSAVIKIAEYISACERFPSSSHHRNTAELIEKVLKDFGKAKKQKFRSEIVKPVEGIIKLPYHSAEIFGIPYTNSPVGKVKGEIVDCGFGTSYEVLYRDLKNKIALVKEGKKPFREKEKLLFRKGVKGIVVYHPEVEEIYNGISTGLLPVISIKRSQAADLLNKEVELIARTLRLKVKGKNLWIDFGRGNFTLTFIAHYDSKPNTKGTIDNALSVSLLLWLAKKVKEKEKTLTYKVRFLFTDMEEYGLVGAKKFVQGLPIEELRSTYVVSVDTIGWYNPAVLTADASGKNDKKLLLIADRILNDLNIRHHFDFARGKSGRSDHIPFKEKGAKTLFLASNPFPFRHTVLDNPNAIVPKYVVLWMKFLKVLALKFDKYLKEVKVI